MSDVLDSLVGGFWLNLQIFVMTLLMALPLGLVITFGSMTKFRPLRYLTRVFVWIIRGTPLMLQLFVVMYMPGLVFGIPMKSRMTAVLIAFVINYAAYFSEIYRGGIESIPKGQYEAGQVLGMTRSQVFFRVVLLQVVKRITPPMSNEVITLVKDTALARVALHQAGPHLAAVLHGALLPAVQRRADAAVRLFREEDGLFQGLRRTQTWQY